MDKKYLEIAGLAAKNIFTRGSNYYRFYRAILILILPFFLFGIEFFRSNDVYNLLAGDLGLPMVVGDIMAGYLSWLIVLFVS